MFTPIYLCLHMFTYVYPCLVVFTYVYSFYLCLPLFIPVYLHLTLFTHTCLLMFTMLTSVYLCLHLFTYLYYSSLIFTYVYHCLFMHVYLCLPLFTHVYVPAILLLFFFVWYIIFWNEKKMAWDGSKSYPDMTEAFMHIALNPYTFGQAKLLEWFRVTMYNGSSDLEHVDDARMASLFCHSNKSMENLPPTRDTLLHHCKRVI